MPQKRVSLETEKMKRGKPHKQETQILVEESGKLETEQFSGIEKSIDRCLSLFLKVTEHGL